MMKIIAILTGKICYLILKIFGSNGAALPGLVAEKIDPAILGKTLSQLPQGVVIVTGTNGKTTSTKMLTAILSTRYRVLTNPTGSNFTRGVVSSVIKNCSLNGKLNYDIAVIELDEAYAVKFVEKYQPQYTLVLNVTRDQMDRFGEIDHTARLLEKVVDATKTAAVLNADDIRVANMKPKAGCDAYFFGVADSLRKIFVNDEELHAKQIVKRNTFVDGELKSVQNGKTTFVLDNKQLSVDLDFFGLYNSQNAVAVALLANKIGISLTEIKKALEKVKPAFGRGEQVELNGAKVVLQLVKNPAGFRQALLGGQTLKVDQTIVAINDKYADGRDVSWLWDVNFASLLSGQIITSGSRAYDMALRLSYDDIKTDKIAPDLTKMINLIKPHSQVIIYTTYTAMLEIRSILAKKTELEAV